MNTFDTWSYEVTIFFFLSRAVLRPVTQLVGRWTFGDESLGSSRSSAVYTKFVARVFLVLLPMRGLCLWQYLHVFIEMTLLRILVLFGTICRAIAQKPQKLGQTWKTKSNLGQTLSKFKVFHVTHNIFRHKVVIALHRITLMNSQTNDFDVANNLICMKSTKAMIK